MAELILSFLGKRVSQRAFCALDLPWRPPTVPQRHPPSKGNGCLRATPWGRALLSRTHREGSPHAGVTYLRQGPLLVTRPLGEAVTFYQ